MKRRIAAGAVALIALCPIAAGAPPGPTPPAGPIARTPAKEAPRQFGAALAPGDRVPSIQGTDLDGNPVKVIWEGTKLNLVNLWATWCGPCRQEMPRLEEIRARHASDGLRVTGIVVLDRASLPAVKASAEAVRVGYAIVVGGGDTQYAFGGIAVVPTTFLLDGEGRVVRKYVGTSNDELDALGKDVDDFLVGRPLGNPYIPPPEPVTK